LDGVVVVAEANDAGVRVHRNEKIMATSAGTTA
jgi:hypothetical protein